MFYRSSWSNLAFKGPRTDLYRKSYQHTSILGRFWADFGGFWGSFGDDLGVFWGVPGPVLARKK